MKPEPRPCKSCGVLFVPRIEQVWKRKGWCCSHRCAAILGGRAQAEKRCGPLSERLGAALVVEGDPVRQILVAPNAIALVDEDLVPLIGSIRWHLDSDGYARSKSLAARQAGSEWMHRLVIGSADKEETDHVNGDKLDNRRSNLRGATRSENQQNRAEASYSNTSLRGIHRLKNGRYQVNVQADGRRCYLGTFATLEAARQAAQEGRRHLMPYSPEARA